ncbi:MAG: peptidylprolyl isomerase [Prevotella sp.]|nr:peptidylprolyl isomerase [Prevotella sp.]MBR3088840.1 peptidylprolyl isomerase [Prevotella sp.]
MNRLFHYSIVPLAMLTMSLGISASWSRYGASEAPDDSTTTATAVKTNPSSIIDEVVWVVGDEPILKSDIESMRMQSEMEGVKWNGNPDCTIPEQLAVQKLFLHQAAIDSIEVTESDISQSIDDQINYWIQLADGSREKLEEYRKMTISQMRQQMHDEFKNRELIQKMRRKLVEDINVSPAEVRRYFENLPEDSIPMVPTTVEVQIITRQPKVSIEEINRVKDALREYTDRVNRGETTFATLARLYSEDGSARQGGEIGYTPKAALDPVFASVAFNLTDPSKISKIVETEFGFHIIQLIDKRGERINVRHILLKPRVTREALEQASHQLDSLANDIREGKFTFDEAATYVSDDKDTKSNHGIMANATEMTRTSKFRMQDLPTEVARAVEQLKVGEISAPFEMINSKGKTVCAIIKLKSRTESHRATITEDFQVMKDVVLAKRREEALQAWVAEKLKNTYVRMADQYRDCDFEYQGWVK